MKKTSSDLSQRILTLIKLDSLHLLERIKERKSDYLEVFALRRTRDHFPHIFKNRYDQATIKDLAHCSVETIEVLDKFYTHVDEIKWYLLVTEDMPNTVDDFISRKIIKLNKLYEMIALYLDADLGVNQDSAKNEEDIPDVSEEQRWIIEEKNEIEDATSDSEL